MHAWLTGSQLDLSHGVKRRPTVKNCDRENRRSTGDEIANVNLFTTISHTNFIIPKKREPTSFSKLNDS